MISILISTILLAGSADPAPAYAAWVKAHPAFNVHVVASVNGKTRSDGDLLVQWPMRFLYKAHGANFSYTVADNESGYLELEAARKIYDEYPSPHGLAAWQSDIDEVANSLVPRFLFVPSAAYLFKGKVDVTTSNGNQVLYQKQTSDMGVVETWITIAPDGHMVSARRKATGQRGSVDTVWTFSDFKFPTKLSLSSFLVQIPSGYVPNSVPRLTTPLQMGQPAPVAGWVDKNGRAINLLDAAGHKPFLIAYIVPDDGPAQASLAALQRLKSKLPVFVVGPDGLKNPSGKALQRLNPPGAPMFYLVGGDGKVSKIWFGYDRGSSASFESDVIASMSPELGNGKANR